MPAHPEPTIATFFPLDLIVGSFAFELSPTNLSKAPIATLSPLIPKTQLPSH